MKVLSRKRILLPLGILLLAVVSGLLLSGWLPAIVRPLAEAKGLTWEHWERNGWQSFTLTGIRMELPGVDMDLDQLTLPQPLHYLTSPTRVEAGKLDIRVKENDPTAKNDASDPGIGLLEDIRAALERHAQWIPDLRLGKLAVIGEEGGAIVELENLSYTGHRLTGRLVGQAPYVPADLSILLAQDGLRVTALPGEPSVLADLWLSGRIDTAGPTPHATARIYSGNVPMAAEAHFVANSWIPESVSANAEQWPVPSRFLTRGAVEARDVMTDVDLGYADGTVAANIHLTGNTSLSGGKEEPMAADIRLSGGFRQIEVAEFRIQTAWLTADLSEPVSYGIQDRTLSGDAEFRAEADLSRQEWIPAVGLIEALVSIRPADTGLPGGKFSLSGNDLAFREIQIPGLTVEGSLSWPQVELEALRIDLGKDGHVEGGGHYDITAQTLTAEADFNLAPDYLAPYLGEIRLLGPLAGQFSASGGLAELRHKGALEPVEVEVPGLHVITVAADWSGAGASQLDLLLDLSSGAGGKAQLDLRATRAAGEKIVSFNPREAQISGPQLGAFRLEKPFDVVVDFSRNLPLVSVGEFRLSGENRYLSGNYNTGGESLSMEAGNLPVEALEAWLDHDLPPVVLDHVAMAASGFQPYLESTFLVSAHSTAEPIEAFHLNMEGATGKDGILVSQADGQLGEETLVRGNLTLPIQLHPVRDPSGRAYTLVSGQPLSGEFLVRIPRLLTDRFPNIPQLASLAGLDLKIIAGGDANNPEARLEAFLPEISFLELLDPRLAAFPFRDLSLKGGLDSDSLRVETFEAKLEDSPITLSGELPASVLSDFLTREDPAWESLLAAARIDLSFGSLRVRSLGPMLPGFLRGTGRIEGDISLQPGNIASGTLRLREFGIRPTLYSQGVEDISLDLIIANTRLSLSEASATVGNSRIEAVGHIDITDLQQPRYSLRITGERTPLFRTPDLLLHADINLLLDGTSADGATLLSGDLALRDSVLLLEFDPLATRTAGGEPPRPPFFSIEQLPFAEWKLDLRLHGNEFLRFKSPYAKALVSAQMRISGTLENPIWAGNLYSSRGTVDFPGIRMSLSRSDIFITRERQETIQLDLNAVGRAASNVVTMRVSGSVDDPHVELASTPQLPDTQIIQLLATGSVDGSTFGNVGVYLGRGLLAPSSGSGLMDRLTVEVGRDVTESERNTVDLYYDLTRRLRLHGQYDKYDQQNVNLEWEIYSK